MVLDVINDRSYPRSPGFQVMHWHEDLQLVYVRRGRVELRTLDSSIRLGEGEGAFINKNVVHHIRQLEECRYNSFLFPDRFLMFYPGCPAAQMVESVVNCSQLPFLSFDGETEWCEEVLALLGKLSELEKNKTEFYVYEVLTLLTQVWLNMGKNILLPIHKTGNVINRRMQIFLEYIEQHYPENVSLGDLAASASVSKSECLRCFKSSMQTTPYKYLSEYRLSKAAVLLKTTDQPIESVANQVGFRLASHFGKCFREKTGFSPSEYRRYGGSDLE